MLTGSIPRRYAMALCEIANGEGILEEIFAQVRGLDELMRDSKEVRLLMEGEMHREQRERILKEILPMFGFSKLFENFILFLALKKRTSLILDIIREFYDIYYDLKNIAPCEVTSTVELKPEFKERVVAILHRLTGKRPDVKWRISRELMGGVVFKVENSLYDLSLVHSLHLLKERLKKNLVIGVE